MKTIASVLKRAYDTEPDQVAITLLFSRQPELPITYRRLIVAAAGVASLLEANGILPGEVVVLILNHGEALMSAFFGAILRGAVPAIMPFLTEKLSPENYRSGLKSLFDITAPAAVITYPEFLPEVQEAASGTQVRSLLNSGQFPDAAAAEAYLQGPNLLPGLSCSPDSIAMLQHSSGTTGLQKGVALSHRAVFNQLKSYAQALQMDSQDVVVSWLPLYHDMGLIAGFLLPVLHRVHLVLLSPFDWVRAPYRLLQAISQYRGTVCWLPNFAYNFCTQKIRDRDLQGLSLASLRAVINCSEPMHARSHQMFLDRFSAYGLKASALATCYAMAENVFAVTQGGIDAPITIDVVSSTGLLLHQFAQPVSNTGRDGQAVQLVSAGRPIENTHLRVLDPQGSDLPDRSIGEIAIQSDCMLTGYYHRPDLTEKAFLAGWYLTGDLGYMANGELYVTGRKKDLIIVGGKNIYPQDLERLAGEVPGIHPGRTVAFGVYNEQLGTEEVVLVAETDNPQDQVDPDYEVSSRLEEEVRRCVTQGSDIALRQVYLVPRGWLLKTSSGKIARSANRQKYLGEVLPNDRGEDY